MDVKRGFLVLLILLSYPSVAFAMMSSSNYTIFADSINNGGVFSSGGAYSLEDTIGESPVGFSTSTSFEVRGGYQAMDWNTLTMTISTTSVDLGLMDIALVKSGSTTVSITTDAELGYNLSITAVAGTHLNDVADGTVTAGVEEYGMAITGHDTLFSDDRAVAAGLNLSSSSTAATNSESVITFKAAITGATALGARSQAITLTASTNI